jgi:hypothetical protein
MLRPYRRHYGDALKTGGAKREGRRNCAGLFAGMEGVQVCFRRMGWPKGRPYAAQEAALGCYWSATSMFGAVDVGFGMATAFVGEMT